MDKKRVMIKVLIIYKNAVKFKCQAYKKFCPSNKVFHKIIILNKMDWNNQMEKKIKAKRK